MEGLKIATHTLTHTGVIVHQREQKHNLDGEKRGKYRSNGGGKRGGDAGTSGTENEKGMM